MDDQDREQEMCKQKHMQQRQMLLNRKSAFGTVTSGIQSVAVLCMCTHVISECRAC